MKDFIRSVRTSHLTEKLIRAYLIWVLLAYEWIWHEKVVHEYKVIYLLDITIVFILLHWIMARPSRQGF